MKRRLQHHDLTQALCKGRVRIPILRAMLNRLVRRRNPHRRTFTPDTRPPQSRTSRCAAPPGIVFAVLRGEVLHQPVDLLTLPRQPPKAEGGLGRLGRLGAWGILPEDSQEGPEGLVELLLPETQDGRRIALSLYLSFSASSARLLLLLRKGYGEGLSPSTARSGSLSLSVSVCLCLSLSLFLSLSLSLLLLTHSLVCPALSVRRPLSVTVRLHPPRLLHHCFPSPVSLGPPTRSRSSRAAHPGPSC